MAFKIQLRRDLALKWTENNPVLLLGEFGYEYDSGYAKIGDGQTPWQDLKYFVGGTGPFGAKDFISLQDTPTGYTGSNEYYVRVNPNGDGLEFISIETLTSLIDIRGATGFEPGDAGRYLRVNPGGTGFIWDIPGSGTSSIYTSINPTLNTVGGFDELTRFSGTALTGMWEGLLHPELEPKFHSLSINKFGSVGDYINLEVGESIDKNLELHWSISNATKAKPNSIDILDFTSNSPIASGKPTTGQFAYVHPGTAIKYTNKSSHTWRFFAKGSNEINFAKDLTVNWYYPIFFGKAPSSVMTITALMNRIPKPDSTGEYSFPNTDGYIYIGVPDGEIDYNISRISANGMPLVLADSEDGYNYTDSYNLPYDQIGSVNINGVIKNYRLYRSKYKIVNSIKVNISNIDSESESGLRVTGILKPIGENDLYPVLDPKYGVDGLRNVNLQQEMYDIPPKRRKLGMIVGVGSTGGNRIYYNLINNPTNPTTTSSDWKIFNSGSTTYAGGTGPTINEATGINIKGGQRITISLAENPPGIAEYTVDIPNIISGGTASA